MKYLLPILATAAFLLVSNLDYQDQLLVEKAQKELTLER